MAAKPPPPSSPFWKIWEVGTSGHVRIFRLTRGRIGSKMPKFGSPMLLVHHVGAKSGTHRVAPLISLEQPAKNRWLIVASKGGVEKNPAWFHNLKANPETRIEPKGGGTVPVRARILEGEERAEAWKAMVEIYPPYADYQVFAGERVIPVLALERR